MLAESYLLFCSYHKTNPTGTQDLLEIADYLSEQIRNDCTGNEDHIYLILRVFSVFCMKRSFPVHPSLLLCPDSLLFLFNAGHWKYW